MLYSFRFIIELMPSIRENLARQATFHATVFVNKYCRNQFDFSSGGNDLHVFEKLFSGHLISMRTTPRFFPKDRLYLFVEWLSYLWVVMEFYAVQFEKQFETESDAMNPFNTDPNKPAHLHRSVYVQHLVESVIHHVSSMVLFLV